MYLLLFLKYSLFDDESIVSVTSYYCMVHFARGDCLHLPPHSDELIPLVREASCVFSSLKPVISTLGILDCVK